MYYTCELSNICITFMLVQLRDKLRVSKKLSCNHSLIYIKYFYLLKNYFISKNIVISIYSTIFRTNIHVNGATKFQVSAFYFLIMTHTIEILLCNTSHVSSFCDFLWEMDKIIMCWSESFKDIRNIIKRHYKIFTN
jgi:hypothetical protein